MWVIRQVRVCSGRKVQAVTSWHRILMDKKVFPSWSWSNYCSAIWRQCACEMCLLIWRHAPVMLVENARRSQLAILFQGSWIIGNWDDDTLWLAPDWARSFIFRHLAFKWFPGHLPSNVTHHKVFRWHFLQLRETKIICVWNCFYSINHGATKTHPLPLLYHRCILFLWTKGNNEILFLKSSPILSSLTLFWMSSGCPKNPSFTFFSNSSGVPKYPSLIIFDNSSGLASFSSLIAFENSSGVPKYPSFIFLLKSSGLPSSPCSIFFLIPFCDRILATLSDSLCCLVWPLVAAVLSSTSLKLKHSKVIWRHGACHSPNLVSIVLSSFLIRVIRILVDCLLGLLSLALAFLLTLALVLLFL